MKPKILVPFDFSRHAEQALAWAADLQMTTGAEPLQIVHAINCRPPGTGELPLETVLPTADELTTLERSMRDAARRHGVVATARVDMQPSTVGDIILDAARAAGADLIVMGTHGRTGLKRMVLGSVAEQVLRHAPCPVVTVHELHDNPTPARR